MAVSYGNPLEDADILDTKLEKEVFINKINWGFNLITSRAASSISLRASNPIQRTRRCKLICHTIMY